MSAEQSTGATKADENNDVLVQDWIHDVEREETIIAATENEEEVEEFIEVDGIVDEHDIEQNIQLHPNEVIVSSEFCNGSDIYLDNTSAGEELNMNLPDLLSRMISFTNGSKLYLCFSKRCRKQICFEGHLYNIDGFVRPTNWNLWRCANPSCTGAIRTSPNITELRVREPHSNTCRSEDIQIRLRIAVYDLRLMAEFTDLPLDALYHAYLDKVMDEHTDIVHLFPSFETLKANLEEHRSSLIYRRRFAAEARESDTHSMYNASFDITANSAKFKRTKPFPPSLCMNCNAEFRSMPEFPSQDQLLQHIFFDHNTKSAVVNRFTFDDPGLFEQWIRELQYHSKYRFKKLCLHDEHMYYLCQNDIRHFKSNHSRSSIPDIHCTAFVRVHNWRLVIQGDFNEVVVDYCLDHFFHNDGSNDPLAPCKPADLFTPEVFMRDLAVRRERTQQLIQDKGLQRIKRRGQPPSIYLHGPVQKTRSSDAISRDSSVFFTHNNGMKESNGKEDNDDNVFGAPRSEQRQKIVQQMVQERYNSRGHDKDLYKSPYITKRENFADAATYDTVLQLEMSCNMLKDRMQYARSNRTAIHYLGRLTRIVDDVMADPLCAPMNVSEIASSPIKRFVEDASRPSKMPRLLSVSSPSTTSQMVESNERFSLSREAKSEPDGSLPLCQKVLVRKGDNGELVVVRRTIISKVRKVTDRTETISSGVEPLQELQTSAKTVFTVNHCSKEYAGGPPINDLLRDSDYISREPRYDQASLRGVRRMAYQSVAQQDNSCADQARRFVRMFSEHPISRLKSELHMELTLPVRKASVKSHFIEANAIRRPRGHPRKFP